MLLAPYNTLQHLLYKRRNIGSHEVDITFEALTSKRIGKLFRLAVRLFIFKLRVLRRPNQL